jgi:hypothetical protein
MKIDLDIEKSALSLLPSYRSSFITPSIFFLCALSSVVPVPIVGGMVRAASTSTIWVAMVNGISMTMCKFSLWSNLLDIVAYSHRAILQAGGLRKLLNDGPVFTDMPPTEVADDPSDHQSVESD